MAAAAAGMGVGTILEIKGNNLEASAQHDSNKYNINQLKAKENEVMRRMRANTAILEKQSDAQRGAQTTAFAGSGVDVGSGSPLRALAEQEMVAKREIFEMRRQSRLEAKQLHKQQSLLKRERGRINERRDIKNISSVFGFFGSAAKASGGAG